MKMTQDAALQPSLILVLVGLSGDDCVISDKNKLDSTKISHLLVSAL